MSSPSAQDPAGREAFTRSDQPDRICRNCGAAAPLRYCPMCGQSTADATIALRRLVGDALDDVLSLNGALPSTLSLLLLRPGRLTREYLEGRRARYLPPVRLYLVTSFIYFFVVFGIARDGSRATEPGTRSEVSFDIPDEAGSDSFDVWFLTKAQQARLEARMRATAALEAGELDRHIRSELSARVPIAVFLLVPLFAALLHLVHLRSRRFYAEHFVFALHLHSFAFLLFSLIVLVPWSIIGNLLGLAFIVYVVSAMRSVYGQRLGLTLVKLGAVSAIYGVALLVALVTIVIVATLTAPV